MKAHLKGFSIESGNGHVSLEDLFALMEQQSGQSDTSQPNERRLYVHAPQEGRFIKGLIVTVRDQKNFCSLTQHEGNFVIQVQNLLGDDRLMEFNFFVLNRDNGLGLYLHYHQSCSVGMFGNYLRARYALITDNRCADAIAALGPDPSLSAQRRVRREYKRKLLFSPLVSRQSLEDMLKECQKINSFEYEFAAIEQIKSIAAPLQPFARRRRERIVFTPRSPIGELANAVSRAVAEIAPRSGKVNVIDAEGDAVALRIANMPENFGEYEYDEVAQRLNNLDTKDFAKHDLLTELVRICESDDYRHIFMAALRQA